MDATDWDERYAATELMWSTTPNQFVAAELADLPPGRAVDLAAGEGRNAIWLAGLGWDVTAVDFSQVALDKGRQLAGDRQIDWVCARRHHLDRGGGRTTWSWSPTCSCPPTSAARPCAGRSRRCAPAGRSSWSRTTRPTSPRAPAARRTRQCLMTAEDVLADLEGEQLDVVRAERVGAAR